MSCRWGKPTQILVTVIGHTREVGLCSLCVSSEMQANVKDVNTEYEVELRHLPRGVLTMATTFQITHVHEWNLLPVIKYNLISVIKYVLHMFNCGSTRNKTSWLNTKHLNVQMSPSKSCLKNGCFEKFQRISNKPTAMGSFSCEVKSHLSADLLNMAHKRVLFWHPCKIFHNSCFIEKTKEKIYLQ